MKFEIRIYSNARMHYATCFSGTNYNAAISPEENKDQNVEGAFQHDEDLLFYRPNSCARKGPNTRK